MGQNGEKWGKLGIGACLPRTPTTPFLAQSRVSRFDHRVGLRRCLNAKNLTGGSYYC